MNSWFTLALFSRHQMLADCAYADLVEKSPLSFASDLTALIEFQTDVCVKRYAALVCP